MAHGGVRLQLGASLEEVELTLIADRKGGGSSRDISSAGKDSAVTSRSSSTAALLASSEQPQRFGSSERLDSTYSWPSESKLGARAGGLGSSSFSYLLPAGTEQAGLVRFRLRQLKVGWQKRARGGFRLRVGGLPLDAYDLRRSDAFHVVGVVGARGDPDRNESRSPRTATPSPAAAAAEVPWQAMRRGPTLRQHQAWPRSQSPPKNPFSQKHPAQQQQHQLQPPRALPPHQASAIVRAPTPDLRGSDSPLAKRMFSWRSWRGESDPCGDHTAIYSSALIHAAYTEFRNLKGNQGKFGKPLVPRTSPRKTT